MFCSQTHPGHAMLIHNGEWFCTMACALSKEYLEMAADEMEAEKKIDQN